jgi:hypothetical protein
MELGRIGTGDQDLRFSAFQIRTRSLDTRMSRNLVADLDHLIKTSECSDSHRLRSVRGYDCLQDHLGTTMNLSKVRKKRIAEVGVKARHLFRVVDPETFQ